MKEIKRCDVVLVDGVPAHRPSESGRWVKHEDHAAIVAALQEQVRALAAEGKKKANCLAFFASVIKCGESWSDTCQRDYDAAFKTPATDSALREIRAQSVEAFAEHIAFYHSDSKSHALDYASRIRAGEQP